jgi:uncharacterized membrane protein YraQ (UPF0718 family)
MLYRKRIAILIVLIAALLAWFWLGSRYPSLDEKAAMAGEVVMGDVLSFEAHVPVDPSAPLWQKIIYSTINWVLTNRQGMTFGVLLATLVLTLLQLKSMVGGKPGVFRDTLKGMLVGAPLGVCVNCAAPIAYGMSQQGMRKGTSLATMFASPTLNIVVLAMTFSVLPMYMAVTKVVATFLFILLALPLLVRYAAGKEGLVEPSPAALGEACDLPRAPEPWSAVLPGLVKDLWRNFLFILVRTVPLMFLAGLLGAAMANLIPLDSVADWAVSLSSLVVVALLGTFAPVPIAFDVVLVQALLVAGLSPELAMVLLFTLGLFSIYPLMLVAKMLSWRFSGILFVSVAAFGVGAGLFAGNWESYQAEREARMFEQRFSGEAAAAAETAPAGSGQASGMEGETAMRLPPDAFAVADFEQGRLKVSAAEYLARSPVGANPFTHRPGSELGLANTEPVVLDFMVPFSQGRGVAAGDFNGDGWPDLAVADNVGVRLFRNASGSRFEEVALSDSRLQQANVLMVALVDLDNDGCLDLFAGTFGDHDYIAAGDCGDFAQTRVAELPHLDGLMTQAAAFADIDRDGDLDILKGNWFFVVPRTAPSPRATNLIALNQGGLEFSQSPLQEIVGDTLTVNLTDLDQDGLVDMIIGNDYMEPDIYYQGESPGQFRQLAAGGPVPATPLATMSIDAADIDNDLDIDLFLTGKVNDFALRRGADGEPMTVQDRVATVVQRRKSFEDRYCALFESQADRDQCTRRIFAGNLMRKSSIGGCNALESDRQKDECMIAIRIKNAMVRRDWSFCPKIPASEFPAHRQMCEAYAEYFASGESKETGYMYEDRGAIAQTPQGNVLLRREADGRYTDHSQEAGVFDAFWAWNARFADLDLDEWQDLYVVNGWWLETSMYTNKFFHNQGGQRFEAREEEFGLANFRKQHAFVYLDFDRDGDLDIISRSLAGEFDVFTNNVQGGNSVSFEFRDEAGNHFGIGNRIKLFYGDKGERHQMREIKGGGGFVSFDPPMAHFGLGDAERVGRVEIEWNDGARSVIEQPLESGRNYIIVRHGPASDLVVQSP